MSADQSQTFIHSMFLCNGYVSGRQRNVLTSYNGRKQQRSDHYGYERVQRFQKPTNRNTPVSLHVNALTTTRWCPCRWIVFVGSLWSKVKTLQPTWYSSSNSSTPARPSLLSCCFILGLKCLLVMMNTQSCGSHVSPSGVPVPHAAAADTPMHTPGTKGLLTHTRTMTVCVKTLTWVRRRHVQSHHLIKAGMLLIRPSGGRRP